ncbi:hypothetical protein PAJ34TS1_57740 [Paenibacillus azoreducens]|uniref:Uncharacterized protein n=1 Tax=Paenibacillus azoreducens TaxID=116718 RepID=A0A919Y9Z5_9BACL|nr:hypothetical protein J34TS1_21370 [Paenibacillus azoreducens]
MEHMGVLPEGHRKAISRTATRGSRAKRISAFFFRRVEALIRFSSVAAGALFGFLCLTSSVSANSIQDSKLAKGTEKLIGDATTWLMILAPVVTGLLIIYFFIRRSAADEMDTKKWNNRIIVAVVSCIGAVLGSALLNVIIGYYK